jgi:hypothetical protein
MADDQLELQQKYAWDWFSYHASQRLTAFNFFLVLMGAVIVGYGQAFSDRAEALGVALGLLGFIVAVAFWAMDVRNEELVRCGREALGRLEPRIGVSITGSDGSREQLKGAMGNPVQGYIYAHLVAGRPQWITHGRWLRAVISLMGLMSVAAGVWAAAGFGK